MSQLPIPAPSVRSTVTTCPGPASRTSSRPSRSRSRSSAASSLAVGRVGEVLGGDQVLVAWRGACGRCRSRRTGRASSSRSTGPVEVVEGPRPVLGPAAIASTLSDVRSICLWRSLISRYLTWKLRQNAPRSQRASGRSLRLGRVEDATRRPGSRRPAAPTRPSRHTSRSGRRRGRSGGARSSQADGVVVVSQSAFASSASKNRSTQRRSPQQCSQVVGHAPNFSPSSPIIPTRVAVLGGVLAQVVDDLARRRGTGSGSGGPARSRTRAGAWPWSSVVYGPQRSSSGIAAARKWASSRIVQRVAGGDERGRQVRFPDALGEPGAARPPPEQRLQLVAPSGAAGRSGRAPGSEARTGS